MKLVAIFLVGAMTVFGILMLVSLAFAAPTLSWDAVTTDTSGAPLGAGLQVTSYNVYRCAVNVTPCTKAAGVKVGTVTAPATSFDLAGQAFPENAAVTAVNVVAESAESLTLKITPSDVPKNPRVGP